MWHEATLDGVGRQTALCSPVTQPHGRTAWPTGAGGGVPSPRHGACAVRGLSDRWRVGARVGGGPMGGWSSSRNTVVTGAAEVCEASTGPPARRVTCHLPGALGGLVHIHGDRPGEAIVR